MKILCLHKEIVQPGGSETFMLSIIKELSNLGHIVNLFTEKTSSYTEEFKPFCYIHEKPDIWQHYVPDFVICMHRPMAKYTLTMNCKKVYISNGILPIALGIEGFDKYFSVSEEVQHANKKLGFDSEILYNGIDLELFHPKKSSRKTLKKVLMISNHDPGVIHTVKEACDLKGLQFKHIGGRIWYTHVQDFINESDLIVSLGRGIYEAMACGRNCIIYDYRGGDGFLTEENYHIYIKRNCSGRTGMFKWNARQLSELFKFYHQDRGPQMRFLAENFHDIKFVTKKILLSSLSQ
jgi:hypothetical protein